MNIAVFNGRDLFRAVERQGETLLIECERRRKIAIADIRRATDEIAVGIEELNIQTGRLEIAHRRLAQQNGA